MGPALGDEGAEERIKHVTPPGSAPCILTAVLVTLPMSGMASALHRSSCLKTDTQGPISHLPKTAPL